MDKNISASLTRIKGRFHCSQTFIFQGIIALVISLLWMAASSCIFENITVCSSGCDFTTIQAAIDNDATEAGAVIEVADPIHTEADILVNKDVVIQGRGSANTIVQSHADVDEAKQRVFSIAAETIVTIRAITIRHGNPASEPQSGGAIRNEGELLLEECVIRDNKGSAGGGIFNDGTLTLVDSTLTHNTATGGNKYYECNTGGGIKNMAGEVTLINSTVSDNTAKGKGGGLHIACNGKLILINSTISGNSTNFDGGGIYINGEGDFSNSTIYGNQAHNGGGVYVSGTREEGLVRGLLSFSNTIIAGNTITFTQYGNADCMLGDYATIDVNRNNLVEDGSCDASFSADPMLLPLADNGGLSQTHMPSPSSLVIDAVPIEACFIDTDQRGVTRPVGAGCDIGAVEFVGE